MITSDRTVFWLEMGPALSCGFKIITSDRTFCWLEMGPALSCGFKIITSDRTFCWLEKLSKLFRETDDGEKPREMVSSE
jgi:predicted outer membrane lipoprotein